jgi:1-aminocyclopropane-1-carboxylate deaminase/D-cysteine desulfhydrase-like pyridoxal-dependent ACC family enzyme
MIPYGLDAIVTGNAMPPTRLPLGAMPTPLEYRPDLSRDLGIELFLKREDRVDDLGCGNKIRKLAYVVSAAIDQNATLLVTTGSLPSNQCKAIAAVASRYHLRVHVIYAGDHQARPIVAHGNYLVTSLLEPTISWFEYTPWKNIDCHVARVVEEKRRMGERPYVIPPGASEWPGLMGSIELGFELSVQLQEAGSSVTDIIMPAGSGGTCLGIKIAAEKLGLPWRVFGICIGERGAIVAERMLALRKEAALHIGLCQEQGGELIYDDSARGSGYDLPQAHELEAMRTAMQRYGLIFDPNYMIKALLGLRKLIANGTIKRGAKVVLIHTGGHFGLFDLGSSYAAWHRNRYAEWLR